MIKHFPIFDTEKVIKTFSERDGVQIVYVCTSDILRSDNPKDIFYRADGSPHPEFGNRYFGLSMDRAGSVWISDADKIEDLEFGLVENDAGELEYSQSHHDYKQFKNGNMIDGGREYIRTTDGCHIYRVVDGSMVTVVNAIEDNKNIVMSSN
jgi:hypothetical protein